MVVAKPQWVKTAVVLLKLAVDNRPTLAIARPWLQRLNVQRTSVAGVLRPRRQFECGQVPTRRKKSFPQQPDSVKAAKPTPNYAVPLQVADTDFSLLTVTPFFTQCATLTVLTDEGTEQYPRHKSLFL